MGIVEDARVLRMALCGPRDTKWPDSLNVVATLRDSPETLRDLGGLLGPLVLVLYTIAETFQRGLGGAALVTAASVGDLGMGDSVTDGGLSAMMSSLADIGDGIFLLASGWYTLRFFRLVIKERDAFLAESIRGACRECPGQPVVAVLGLLHCNGVAETLRHG
ncbi:unnamed protein product [Discosporangium mesarthrocarpum]